jgi:hypothetical protein
MSPRLDMPYDLLHLVYNKRRLFMRVSYQRGHLRCVKRQSGPPRWEFLWREKDRLGKSIRRNALIGTLEQYPTEESAETAVNGLRMQINETRSRQREQSIFVADLIDHYITTELDDQTNWRSHATCVCRLLALRGRVCAEAPRTRDAIELFFVDDHKRLPRGAS